MTEVAEMVSVSLANDVDVEEICPFCNEGEHPFPGKKNSKPDYEVVSDPSGLDPLPDIQKFGVDYPWSKARHHLISAKQCYAKLLPLVRMGKMLDYDINSNKNGIALPTISTKTKYPVFGGGEDKYGAFNEDGKRNIAFTVMSRAKAQWHVGHHAVEIKEVTDQFGEEVQNEDDVGHRVSYDTTVVEYLLLVLYKFRKSHDLCKEGDEDLSKQFIDEMNLKSDLIRKSLDKFGTAEPWNDENLYVSKLAFDYAGKCRAGHKFSEDDEPEAGNLRPKKKTKGRTAFKNK